ncbi:hypothetical protein BVX94_01950 [bacterium B17]|nr:hypothetical protein BVX94_01950 [bacterium B17]
MKILIIKMSSLGDLFHALPAVHNLKVKLNAQVDWVVHDAYADLVDCFQDVDRVIQYHRNDFFSTFGSFWGDIRTDRYDYIIDFQGLLKSAMVSRLANGGKRIGPSFYREGARMFYSEVAGERNKERHAVEENLDIIDHLGLERMDPEFPIMFPAAPMKVMAASSPKVAMLPSSRWETKNWPEKSFAAVGKELREKVDASIILLGGPGDAGICGRIEQEIGDGVVNLAGKCSLPETGGVLSDVDLLISNDSGPVHMAAAVGTPAVVVFGPTDPDRTGPYGDIHKVVKATEPCSPCFSRTCNKDGFPCMNNIKPEQVIEKALDILKK